MRKPGTTTTPAPSTATAARPSTAPGAPLTTPSLVYLLAEFPSLSETFILREMLDLVGRGMPLGIYAFRPPAAAPVHAEARALMDRVAYRPRPGSAACARAHLRVLARRPLRYVRGILRVLSESRGYPPMLRRRLVAFDAAVGLAAGPGAGGIRHIHAHFAGVTSTAGRYASLLLGVPFSFSAHAHDLYVDGRQDRAALSANLGTATFVVTCTEYNRRYLLAECPGVPPAKLHRVYHGIDVTRFAAGPRRNEGVPTVLAVGRLVPKKGLRFLIEACGLLCRRGREVSLIVVGDGPERSRLEALAREQGIAERVRFVGEVTQEEVVPLYASGDILALPCVIDPSGDRDGIPNVLLEALAAGMAVVSTPISGIPEVVEEGKTGLLVPPENASALAEALERLIADPGLRRRLGDAGRERVARDFDIRNSPMAGLFTRLAGIPAGKELR